MGTETISVLKHRLNVPRFFAMIVALIGVIVLFLPIISATPDFVKRIGSVTDLGYNELDDIQLSDLKDLSLYSYGRIYYNHQKNVDHDDAKTLLILMLLPGAGALLAFLFASGKHPFFMLLMDLVIAGSFWVDTKWIGDIGLMVSETHEWSSAYYVYPACIVLLAMLSIWMFIAKYKWKKAKKRAILGSAII